MRPEEIFDQHDLQTFSNIVSMCIDLNSSDIGDNLPSLHSVCISNLLAKCAIDALNHSREYVDDKISETLHRLRAANTANILKLGHEELWIKAAKCLTAVVTQIIEFAKMIPGFLTISQDDQIVLLKACAFELAVIRVSRQFDPRTNSFPFGEELLTTDTFRTANITEKRLIFSIFDVARNLAEIKLNDTQLALYSAYVLLSPDRPGLTEQEQVRKLQAAFSNALRFTLSLTHRYPVTGIIPAANNLLALVPQLRLLSRVHFKALSNMRRIAPHLEFSALYQEVFPTEKCDGC